MIYTNIFSGVVNIAASLGLFAAPILGEMEIDRLTKLQQFERQVQCLAENIYHEARSESEIGQIAVGYVTLNRVKSKNYPNSLCKVVYQAKKDQNGIPVKNKCQFSWYCDGKPDDIKNLNAWVESYNVAILVAMNKVSDPTEGAVMYHADYVNPYWTKQYSETVQIDAHLFYK